MLKVGTTFSGIGAPEQALKKLKILHEVKWACDIDKFAKQTYLANHFCQKWYDDITKINLDELEYVDLYIFGFPCQDLSIAGNKDLSKGRSILVKYSLNIINKIKPKYFLFENVKNLLNKKFCLFFQYIIDNLSKDYNLFYDVLNSKDFGVPQNRERVFCVGIRKDIDLIFNFPSVEKLTLNLKNLLEPIVDKKYFIQSKLKKINNNSKQNKKSGLYYIGSISSKNYQYSIPHSQRVYSINGNAICICVDKPGNYLVDNDIRKLTERECARLQGFPDDFIIPVSRTQSYKQFGNTITVNILEKIFKNLLIYHL